MQGQTGLELYAEVYASGSTTPQASGTGKLSASGTGEVLIPISQLTAKNYHWTMKVKKGNQYSVAIQYGNNGVNEVDFAIFNGFEPYPWGYKFPNSSPSDTVLN